MTHVSYTGNRLLIMRWVIFLIPFFLVTAIMVLPNTSLAWLRGEFHWLERSVSWIEALWPAVDLIHLLLFALLGFTARVVFPEVRLLSILMMFALFSSISEVVQFWIPGRTPLISDFIADMIGSIIGSLIGILICFSLKRISIKKGIE